MSISLLRHHVLRASTVLLRLPVIAWAMLRVRNEHSLAFRGRYSPETAPWGVEIVEAQYWQHVRTVDVVGPPQAGKTFHVCELPTLYDLCEGHETVFYMNGSADNAVNIWSTRWLKTLRADPVLRDQILDRMEAGTWQERHFRDNGLLYSAGPESAAALSQRESRIVRCSELEKTRAQIGNEASSYALASDRAAAYPGSSLITSDCTVTVADGLSWVRFTKGDRSRPFIPCPACGHYACPAHPRHVARPELALDSDSVHLLEVAEISASSPTAAEETTRLVCKKCEHVFSDRELRESIRAVVWVPVDCKVVRRNAKESADGISESKTTETTDKEPRGADLAGCSAFDSAGAGSDMQAHQNSLMAQAQASQNKVKPIPKVRWLDELRAWAGEQLADPDVTEGMKSPADPPKWRGPRLPDGVELAWSPELQTPAKEGELLLPAFRPDPRKNSARSFWFWRIFSPKYTIGQVGAEIVKGDVAGITGDLVDDYKTVTQKCLVLPYVELVIGNDDDLSEDAVRQCVCDLPRGARPESTIAISAGVDINEDYVRAVKRAWTADGQTYLIDHGIFATGKLSLRERGIPFDDATRTRAIYDALDRCWSWLNADEKTQPGMTYVDSGFLSDEIYEWCGTKAFARVRPSKGFGDEGTVRRRRQGALPGQWSDACQKAAVQCRDARGRPLKHQFYDPKDPRRLMKLHVDHWKKEVHAGVRVRSVYLKALATKTESAAAKPWFWIHADLSKDEPDVSRCYVRQLVAERWEKWLHPKTQREESGWRAYREENHFLDCEAYAFAAAAVLGVDVGKMTGAAAGVAIKRARPKAPRPAPRHDPMLG